MIEKGWVFIPMVINRGWVWVITIDRFTKIGGETCGRLVRKSSTRSRLGIVQCLRIG